MTAKKTTEEENVHRRVIARNLSRQETVKGKMVARQMKPTRARYLPIRVKIFTGLCAVVVAGVLGVFFIAQQTTVNKNMQQFLSLRKTMKSIVDFEKNNTPSSEWTYGEYCRYSSNGFELTYAPRARWTCAFEIERPALENEDIDTSRKQLINILSTYIAGKKSSDFTVEADEGLHCFSKYIPEDDQAVISLGCSGGAYKSWYRNSEPRSATEGKDAWQGLEGL